MTTRRIAGIRNAYYVKLSKRMSNEGEIERNERNKRVKRGTFEQVQDE